MVSIIRKGSVENEVEGNTHSILGFKNAGICCRNKRLAACFRPWVSKLQTARLHYAASSHIRKLCL